MKNVILVIFSLFLFNFNILGQTADLMIPAANSDDYYYQIPEFPDAYTAENVAARMIDGLGFRFYWATEGLVQSDMEYRPSEEGRSTAETIDHVYGLSLTIINATINKVNEPVDRSEMTVADKRKLALENIKTASENLKKALAGEIEGMKTSYRRSNGGTADYPFWIMLNGPIADALYHTGQIVSFRRSSGHPINPNISVFTGSVRN